jgi:PAS domain S-box-containing protein
MLAATDDAARDDGLLVKTTLVGVSVFLLAYASLSALRQTEQLAVVWPANAVILAVLLRSRRSSWPAILTAGLIGNLAGKFLFDRSLSPGVLLPVANALEVFLCASFTRRFAGEDIDLSRPRHLGIFVVFAGLAAPAASAVASATILLLWGGSPWLASFVKWWVTDALGLLIVTPALLALTPQGVRDLWAQVRTGRGALSIAALAVTWAMVFGQTRFDVIFLAPMALIFVAFELHLTGAAIALLANAAIATALTVFGVPAAGQASLGRDGRIVLLQAFLAAMTLLVLPVAAALANRVRLGDALRRKQAETATALERLGDSEARYRMLTERTVDLIVRYDLNGVIEYMSPSVRQYGFEPEELIGRTAAELLHPDDVADASARFAMLADDQPLPSGADNVFRSRRADGSWAWMEANPSPVRNETGKVVGAVSVLRDITQRVVMEEELRRRTVEAERVAGELSRTNWALSAYAKALSAISHFDSLDTVASAICSAIVEQDEYVLAAVGRAEVRPGLPIVFIAGDGPAVEYLDGLELSWSPKTPGGLGPTGRAVREFMPILVADSLAEDSLGPWRERAASFGIRSSVTVPFRSGENAVGVLSIYARVVGAFGARELELFFSLGRELGLAVSMGEARERMEALEAARRAAEQTALSAQLDLVRAGRILSVAEVTTSIAHEVNQPIAAILANAETALNWIGKPTPNLDGAKAAMQRVIRDAERAGDTVKRVRRMISKEAPQFSPCGLNQLVEETLGAMDHEIRLSGVELRRRLSPQSPLVQVDKVQIEQVLVNLISNSLEAMRKDAHGPGERLLVVRTGLADPNNALVAVEDSGAGFSAAIEEKMFEHFFTTKDGGVGLGLALCRAIVQGHGGRIWAEPREGGGAVFQFTLPLISACWEANG